MKHYPYWWDTLPGLASGAENSHLKSSNDPAEALPARADVVVVGAGYTGLSAARQLARGGASVVVVEPERVGWGASSRNGGQVLTGLKLDPATLVARFGESRARELFDASLESIATLERIVADEEMHCEYERTGHVQAASKPSHFEGFREEQSLLARVFNHRVDLVPAADQPDELGSMAYHGLMVDERSGALNPALYVNQLADAARRAGAAIFEDTPVTSVSRAGRGVGSSPPGAGPIQAGELLVATNGYATAATPWLQRRFVPIGSYIIATAPLTPEPDGRAHPEAADGVRLEALPALLPADRRTTACCSAGAPSSRSRRPTRPAAARRFCAATCSPSFRRWPRRRSSTRGAGTSRSRATRCRTPDDSTAHVLRRRVLRSWHRDGHLSRRARRTAHGR